MNRYKVVRELGRNQEGGRITYLATDTGLDPPVQVVIKEFRFALASTNWSGFKAYEREIEVLRGLNHPRIPRYLDSFEKKSGFCLVQEYKNALSLAVQRSFTAEDIKKIAVSVLEILVYLQKRTPPIIHRDIKPENILVDKSLNAYLVDFGFARIRGNVLALSSVAAGTPGFMPPEEQFGRNLTQASDLYSLGATLICLLTGTRSVDVSNLIDDNYRFDFKKLVPTLHPRFISWLEKMVAPNVQQRYPNASDALKALEQIQVISGATWTENLCSVITHKKLFAGLGLATLVIAGMSAYLKGANLRGVHLKDTTMPQDYGNINNTVETQPTRTLAQKHRTFLDPSITISGQNYRLDRCINSFRYPERCSKEAIKEAANTFCKYKAYSLALNWQWEELPEQYAWIWSEAWQNGSPKKAYILVRGTGMFSVIECS